MTELVTTNMPKGRGRKACAPPKKRSKRVHIDTHKTFSEVLQEQTSNQIAFDEDSDSGTELSVSAGSTAVIQNISYASGGDVQSSTTRVGTGMGQHHHSQQGAWN